MKFGPMPETKNVNKNFRSHSKARVLFQTTMLLVMECNKKENCDKRFVKVTKFCGAGGITWKQQVVPREIALIVFL